MTRIERYCHALRNDDQPVVHALAMVTAVQGLCDALRAQDVITDDPATDITLGLAQSSARTLADALRSLLEHD